MKSEKVARRSAEFFKYFMCGHFFPVGFDRAKDILRSLTSVNLLLLTLFVVNFFSCFFAIFKGFGDFSLFRFLLRSLDPCKIRDSFLFFFRSFTSSARIGEVER